MRSMLSLVHFGERIVKGVHVDRAHEIYDCYGVGSHIKDTDSAAYAAALGIVRRADDVVLVEELHRLLAAESVISCGYDVGSCADNGVRRAACDAVALRGVLAVYYSNVNVVIAFYAAELVCEKFAACPAYDVTYKKKSLHGRLSLLGRLFLAAEVSIV